MEVRKSTKHVPTYEKTRNYTNFERYKTFDVEGFFKDKILKVVEVLSTKKGNTLKSNYGKFLIVTNNSFSNGEKN